MRKRRRRRHVVVLVIGGLACIVGLFVSTLRLEVRVVLHNSNSVLLETTTTPTMLHNVHATPSSDADPQYQPPLLHQDLHNLRKNLTDLHTRHDLWAPNLNQVIQDFIRRAPNATPSRIIWQTWMHNVLPPSLESYWNETMVQHNPEYKRIVLNDDDAEAFLRQHFGVNSRIYQAYRVIDPNAAGAMRADLWRYAVLYVHGGVYIDADALLLWWRHKEDGHEKTKHPPSLAAWVDRHVVLAPERVAWSTQVQHCAPVWERGLRYHFPSSLHVSNHSWVQFLLVFPLPGHPVLWAALQLATYLILNAAEQEQPPENLDSALTPSSWISMIRDDKNSPSTHHKVVALSGPVVFSIAIDAVYSVLATNVNITTATTPPLSSSSTWEEMLWIRRDGREYLGKIKPRNSLLAKDLQQEKRSYSQQPKNAPLFRRVRQRQSRMLNLTTTTNTSL